MTNYSTTKARAFTGTAYSASLGSGPILLGSAARSRPAAACWLRPAPAPTCGGFLVTEATAEFPLKMRSADEFDSRFPLGVSCMHNLTATGSVGGVAAWDVRRGWAMPAPAEMRYRHRLTPVALDFGAGIAQQGVTSLTLLGTGSAKGRLSMAEIIPFASLRVTSDLVVDHPRRFDAVRRHVGLEVGEKARRL